MFTTQLQDQLLYCGASEAFPARIAKASLQLLNL